MHDSLTTLRKACDTAAGALDVAEQAVKASKRALAERPPITLVKVAAATYDRIAQDLHSTGLFTAPVEKLAAQLQQADKPMLLTLLEKLASKAVFVPVDSGFGTLVPKSDGNGDKKLKGIDAIWAAASAEVDGR